MREHSLASPFVVALTLGLLAAPCAPMCAQVSGFPHDWSSQHLVFSQPDSATARLLNQDPRYLYQSLWRNLTRAMPARIGAKRDWSENLGSGAKVGADNYPAKYTFVTSTASCRDFVVFNTGLPGATSQPTIIAYTNLYAGCGGTVPTVYWQYNTSYVQGTDAPEHSSVTTSVTLSADGSQVAFIQNTGSASLVLLKWKSGAGLVNMDTSSNNVTPANYRSCLAPCMTKIPFAGNALDSISSPFYFYGADTLYVGDDAGAIHKFQPIFDGAPAEISNSAWPVVVCTGCLLTGPVFDSVHALLYIGDDSGRLDAIGGPNLTVTASQRIGFNLDIEEAPLVDSSAGTVYAFVDGDNNGNSGVFQFPYNFAAGSHGTEAAVGLGNGLNKLYAGAFDNAYYTSAPASPTGDLYVCGNVGASPVLYQISIASGAMSTSATAGPTLTSKSVSCSPVTEIFSNPADWIFLSVTGSGSVGITAGGNTCAGSSTVGCVYSFNVASGTISAATQAANGLATSGGSSGIIIDNTASSPTGASQIYFSTGSNQICSTSGGTGGCAMQASQSGLR
jgi:hypothetical protein